MSVATIRGHRPPTVSTVIAMTKAKATHLIGAYGMFWQRQEIDWDAGHGQTYQLLGYRGDRNPKLEVADFRRARGIYVLFNDFGATYVGRARGNEGFGSRLKKHNASQRKDWNRFCWFSFDSILPINGEPNWRTVARDEGARNVHAESAIDELEALMITSFGLHGTQNRMRLPTAREPWKQLTFDDCAPGKVGRRFDGARVRMGSLRRSLEWD
ncbi:hypothetical protein GCM10022242_24260 [Nocardioides panacisoli]|uniref:GIY-YIG nuclease family protein n=1 Tax=Nocardioides panacisoli TaxID=627624 RepID=A0ABP7IML9_9ACTN